MKILVYAPDSARGNGDPEIIWVGPSLPDTSLKVTLGCTCQKLSTTADWNKGLLMCLLLPFYYLGLKMKEEEKTLNH